jgi:ABC-type transporter MlaC component
MLECETCARELVDDSNYCDICGSLQPRQSAVSEQPPSFPGILRGSLIDVALNALTTLGKIWYNIPEAERAAVTSAITTYLLTRSSDTLTYLRDWLNKKKIESSPLDPTS